MVIYVQQAAVDSHTDTDHATSVTIGRNLWLRYDTTRDVLLTCAGKPTCVSLIYRTEPTIKKCKNRKKLKCKNGHVQK